VDLIDVLALTGDNISYCRAATDLRTVMIARGAQAGPAVRFDFMHGAGQRKIDDIRSASHSDPWSIRGILETSLKN
jgi:hypothetical protein